MEARDLGSNLSRTLGDALAAHVKRERNRRLAEESRASAEYWNR
ncbi:MAG: type II toxin-antitoxin system CcdA family antitoxin [Janthinobacterium lividum]